MASSESANPSGARIKLNLPKIRGLTFKNFSLYFRQPVIKIGFRDGVFCLAGANGLGKSTFLAALNYAITGIVSDPERPFQSVDEYYRFSLDFSKDYADVPGNMLICTHISDLQIKRKWYPW